MVRSLFTVVLFLSCCSLLPAQPGCFSTITLDRNHVYIQQPIKVTFIVYTTTWFTSPPDFENLSIPDAFVVPFTQSQPGQYTHHGQSYAGIAFYFLIFPLKEGTYRVPVLNITVNTPPPGSAESQPVALRTASPAFSVDKVPGELLARGHWMVSKGILLHDQWKGITDSLKVGDVIERTTIIEARGTLPQLIPEVRLPAVSWAGIYPQASSIEDKRNENDVNGLRILHSSFLLLKAGAFEVPAIDISWWNPYTASLSHVSTKPLILHVKHNPSPGMLTSLKDSLSAAVPVDLQRTQVRPEFLGMAWYIFLVYCLAVLLIILLAIRLGKKLSGYLRGRYLKYLQTEAYAFRRFTRAGPEPAVVLRRLYQWWDMKNKGDAAISYTLREKGEEQLAELLEKSWRELYRATPESEDNSLLLREQFKAFRKKNRKQRSASMYLTIIK